VAAASGRSGAPPARSSLRPACKRFTNCSAGGLVGWRRMQESFSTSSMPRINHHFPAGRFDDGGIRSLASRLDPPTSATRPVLLACSARFSFFQDLEDFQSDGGRARGSAAVSCAMCAPRLNRSAYGAGPRTRRWEKPPPSDLAHGKAIGQKFLTAWNTFEGFF